MGFVSMEKIHYFSNFPWQVIESPFGDLLVFWSSEHATGVVKRIFLPGPGVSALQRSVEAGYMVPVSIDVEAGEKNNAGRALQGEFSSLEGNQEVIRARENITGNIHDILAGARVQVDISLLDFSCCTPFQEKVLRALHTISPGTVTTYGELARRVGQPGAARAVGNVMATNPFPILLPCHRVLRGDGSLGHYQGGIEMKRALLLKEGIEISPSGRVLPGTFSRFRENPPG